MTMNSNAAPPPAAMPIIASVLKPLSSSSGTGIGLPVAMTLVVVTGIAVELDVTLDDVVIGIEMVLATSIDEEGIAVVLIVIIKLLFTDSSDVITTTLVGLSTGTVLILIISVIVNTSTGVISGLVTSTVEIMLVCGDTVVFITLGVMLILSLCAAVSN